MLLKDVSLVDIENNDEKIVFNFVSNDNELYEVIFRKQVYNQSANKYEPSPEKEKQVDEWCQEYFGYPMKNINKAVGDRKDIYVYPTFCSMWEVDSKFTPDQEGKILDAVIRDIQMLNDCIYVRFTADEDGRTYAKRYGFTKEIEGQKYPSPQKKAKRLEEFERIFKTPFDDKDELIGRSIKVEVKKAFGQYLYADIKKL